ncbi:MAG: sigma-70 family RNA polymerase sigma factor [Verrucomicrobia bacterium]|nr:sigma-70 family RNA polymerase sigma factor [Verrucomicrobiota bacterium]
MLSARGSESPTADSALATLCKSYWYPLYAFIRRKGHGPAEAQDLTQEFFARLLAKHYFDKADPQKGRFRSFLLNALTHFLADEWDRVRRLKRGGGRPVVSLDDADAEGRYRLEPVEALDAAKIYERRWALTLLERVLTQLEAEHAQAGKTELFAQLQVVLLGDKGSVSYVELGRRLGMSEGAVKVAVHRMRKRYVQLFRAEIAHTVASPTEIDDEINHLFAVLCSG